MRIELTRVGLLVYLANHYTTRGALGVVMVCSLNIYPVLLAIFASMYWITALELAVWFQQDFSDHRCTCNPCKRLQQSGYVTMINCAVNFCTTNVFAFFLGIMADEHSCTRGWRHSELSNAQLVSAQLPRYYQSQQLPSMASLQGSCDIRATN